MSDLVIGTAAVRMDEPCLLLAEQHLQSPNSRGWRRYQILIVNRGDRPAEFRRDLGPASRFKEIAQFRIPGGAKDPHTGRFWVEHTVGELVDIADHLREVAPMPVPEARDLWALWHEQVDGRRMARRGRRSVGPGSLQRR